MGFRKAVSKQSALKIGMFGLAGSGKTFTALLMAEGLGKVTGKRIALVDTETGSSFYSMNVPERSVHPEAFDFDVLHTRSLSETLTAVKELDSKEYGVVIIDSISHLWDSAINSFSGRTSGIGTIPMYAWGKIKKPYNDLLTYLLNSPLHLILCGRQANEWGEDEDTGELKRIGVKMKAQGETPHEPHILIHMESVKQPKNKGAAITAFAEKDRTGVLAGQTIEWPSFDNLIKPLLGLLGIEQQQIVDADSVAAVDVEYFAGDEVKRTETSNKLLEQFRAEIVLCTTLNELEAIGKKLNPIKKQMKKADLAELRNAYLLAENKLK